MDKKFHKYLQRHVVAQLQYNEILSKHVQQ